jgi:hypothetical protein
MTTEALAADSQAFIAEVDATPDEMRQCVEIAWLPNFIAGLPEEGRW